MQARRLTLATGLDAHVLESPGPPASERTFVLVHGFTDHGHAWAEVAEQLAPHGHVLAPDLRGHGDSAWIGAGGYYHFMDYVADLDDVIHQLGRRQVVLCGHSMGGSVSAYLAGVRPERIAALALFEGLGPPDMAELDGPARTGQWIDSWKVARRKPTVMADLDEAIARLRRRDARLGEAQARRLAEAGTRVTARGVEWKHDPLHLTFGPYGFRRDVAARYWQRITCPVLIVDGADSQLNLPADERARRRASFARHRHVIIGDAGHAIPRHQPARTAALILELAGSLA